MSERTNENEVTIERTVRHQSEAGETVEYLAGGLTLTVGEAGEPTITDQELARALGYEHPRNIKRLICALLQAGALAGVIKRSRPEQWITGKGSLRSAQVDEYFLTEQQALFVATRSKTARAAELTKAVIAAFVAVRRGLLAPSVAPSSAAPELARLDRLESLTERLLGAVAAQSEQVAEQGRLASAREATIDRLLTLATRRQNTPPSLPAPIAEPASRGGQRQPATPREVRPRQAPQNPRVLRLAALDWSRFRSWYVGTLAQEFGRAVGRFVGVREVDAAAQRLGWLSRTREPLPGCRALEIVVGRSGYREYKVLAEHVPALAAEFARGAR